MLCNKCNTEWVGVTGSNLGWDKAIWTEVFHGFPQLLQASAAIVTQLQNDCFFPNPFEFIIHVSFYHVMLLELYPERTAK
jgi:hypothetical protein